MSDSNDSRPAVNHEAAKSIGPDTVSISPDAPDWQHPVETMQRRYWARQLLESGAGWPVYGSMAWNVLPEGDPRRVAACVAAAAAYTQRYDDLANILKREIADARLAHKHAEDEEYASQAAAHRAQWSDRFNRAFTPFEERRREQIAAAERMAQRAKRDGGAS